MKNMKESIEYKQRFQREADGTNEGRNAIRKTDR